VGYVLDDMLMLVFIEPKPQLHTSRYGLCAIARGVSSDTQQLATTERRVRRGLAELVEDGMCCYS
jgi:hypothetical protein